MALANLPEQLPQSLRSSYPICSKEWFHEQAQTTSVQKVAAEFEQELRQFQEVWNIKRLESIDKQDAWLTDFFPCGNHQNLCYLLEYQYRHFGTFSGGSANIFYVWKGQKTPWQTILELDNQHNLRKSNKGNHEIDETEAKEIARKVGKTFIDAVYIVKGYAENNRQKPLDTFQGYTNLSEEIKKLEEKTGLSMTMNWRLKYYFMLYPDYFSSFLSNDVRRKGVSLIAGLKPGDKRPQKEIPIIQQGFISLFQRSLGISKEILFSQPCYDLLAKYPFFRISEQHTDVTSDSLTLKPTDEKNLRRLSQELRKPSRRPQNNPSGESDESEEIKNGQKVAPDKLNKSSLQRYLDFLKCPSDEEIQKESQWAFVVLTRDDLQIISKIGLLGARSTVNPDENPFRRNVTWLKFPDTGETLFIDSPKRKDDPVQIEDGNNLRILLELVRQSGGKVLAPADYSSEASPALEVHETQETPSASLTPFTTDQYPLNRIFFGAPGTGKSYTLKQEAEALLKEYPNNKIRVTFHPDYSYASFVGAYKPAPTADGKITYEFVPGPFTSLYVEALKHPDQPFVLIIEEINRANVAAVFGDIFQLLDRDKTGNSEYPIAASKELRRYLADNAVPHPDTIGLPPNLLIWATMNSADQGVFPLDTAFKRRWSFNYIGIDDSEEGIAKVTVKLKNGQTINWNNLRKAINAKLLDYGLNEDKLLGPYFIKPSEVEATDDATQWDEEKFMEAFKSKVLMYLFEDAARQFRQSLFSGATKPKLYSDICHTFDTEGIKVVCQDIADAQNILQQEGTDTQDSDDSSAEV